MASIEDLQTLVNAKPAAISSMIKTFLCLQSAVRIAKKVDLRETFGDSAALEAQLAVAMQDIHALYQLRLELNDDITNMIGALGLLDEALARVAAEYVPPEPDPGP